MTDILIAKTDSQINSCYPVLVQLRPQYTEQQFLDQVKKQMQASYQLAFLQDNGKVCAVAGYRYSDSLAWGKFLYVDDLVTDTTQRSKGYGKKLLGWLIEQARQNNCEQLHLDSGTQRKDAHRFYEREGMTFSSHHYQLDLR